MIEHVAYLRYVIQHERPTRIEICDSDSEGAFKVYKHPIAKSEYAHKNPDDPYPNLVETVCVNVCGRGEGDDANFVSWLRKLLTKLLSEAHPSEGGNTGRWIRAERTIGIYGILAALAEKGEG